MKIRIEIESDPSEIVVRSSAEDCEDYFTNEAEAVAHLNALKAHYEAQGHTVEIKKIEKWDAVPLSLI